MLLEEFENTAGVIEPGISFSTSREKSDDFEVCTTMILPFSGDLVAEIAAWPNVYRAGHKSNINGDLPWYIYKEKDFKVGIAMACLGAPALIGSLEEFHAAGFQQFILLGSCEVLHEHLAADQLILPTHALRDEGLSYHYAPASDEIAFPQERIDQLTAILDKYAVKYELAKTWTTDAFFRETPEKVKRRIKAGAQVVDMECSAVIAWSQFRNTKTYQFFYTEDYVDTQNGWKHRQEEQTLEETVFFDIALKIAKEIEHD